MKKFKVLSPITQGVRLDSGEIKNNDLLEGDVIELSEKDATDLAACGAIDPKPLSAAEQKKADQ